MSAFRRTCLGPAEAGHCISSQAPRADPSLEQIVECFAGAGGSGGFCLSFDGRAGLKERARVARILWRDARRDRLLALERRARVEVGALRAGVQRGATSRARRIRTPHGGHAQLVPTRRAADDFPEPGHVERLRRQWRLPARSVFFLCGRLLVAPRLPRCVLIASLPVFRSDIFQFVVGPHPHDLPALALRDPGSGQP